MRHRFRELVSAAAAVAAAAACVAALVSVGPASADGPPGGGGSFLAPGASAGTGTAATLPTGFQDSTVISGLNNPTAVRFASDGRVFVAEKTGLVLEFDSLSATTPTIVADLRSEVDN